MGPNTNPKKRQDELPEWMQGAIPVDEPQDEAMPEWMQGAIPLDAPDAMNVDDDLEAPAMIRMEVGALDKPEDRLTALRKTYPNAEPHGDDNFIMTDPKTGKTMLYNRESWIPSLGDLASIAPEVGEGIGGIVGGVGGAVAGSPVPLVGTVAGGALGAGTGAVVGRELTQGTLRSMFGNEDTRTPEEVKSDNASTFLWNAGGEGAGLLLGKGIQAGTRAIRNRVAGTADDVTKAAQRAEDLRSIGVEPTAGMVSNNPNTVTKELVFGRDNVKGIGDRINGAFRAMDDEFTRVVQGVTNGRGASTKQELGEMLQDQARAAMEQTKVRTNELYGRTADLTAGTRAVGEYVTAELKRLESSRKLLGNSAMLNQGKAYDTAIKQAKAIVQDVRDGATFAALKDARTAIGSIANDPAADDAVKARMQGIYEALTKDMAETARVAGPEAEQAWRKANNQFRRTRDPESIFNTKNSIEPILKKPSGEEVYGWVTGQVKNGGTRVAAVRRQIEKSGGAEAWDELTGTVIDRMGRVATPEGLSEFNHTKFLREWQQMAPEAKDALFKGTSRTGYRQDLDRLARIAENMKGYAKHAIHSNTANFSKVDASSNLINRSNLLLPVLGAAYGDFSGAATGFAANGVVGKANSVFRGYQSKLLQDPEVVNWLARIPQAEVKKGGLQAHLRELANIKRGANQATRTAINEYLREIGYEDQNQ